MAKWHWEYLIVLIGAGLEELLGALDVEQDGAEGADGIGVAPHHHVGEPHVVGGGDLTRRHMRVLTL